MTSDADVTRLLLRWRDGDRAAFDELLEALYAPLTRLAHARLAGERAGHTLNTGALVHEAWVRLVKINQVNWRDRAHFVAMASRVMSRVLADYAAQRQAKKRGGDATRADVDPDELPGDRLREAFLELDDVLRRFQARYPRQARATELYYFGGLTQEEVAEAIGVSQPTVLRDLRFAQAWLARAWQGDLSIWRGEGRDAR
jgi:RNA polymerase sigma factor (TIGR02999 family)